VVVVLVVDGAVDEVVELVVVDPGTVELVVVVVDGAVVLVDVVVSSGGQFSGRVTTAVAVSPSRL
jgi:membrane-bound inhibitor of C-type lysozyme